MRLSVIWKLIKASYAGSSFTERFSFSSRERKKNKTSAVSKGLLALLIAGGLIIGVGSILLMLGFNYYSFQQIGIAMGHPDFGMLIAVAIGALFVFIFSLVAAPNGLYQGKDLPLLMTLPVSQAELLTSRVLLIYINMTMFYTVFVLPGIVVSALFTGVTLQLILGGILLLIIGPLLPTMLGCVVGMCILRIRGKRGSGGAGEFITVLLLVAVVMLAQRGMMTFTESGIMDDPYLMIETFAGILTGVYRFGFPFALKSAMLFSTGGLVSGWLGSVLTCLLTGVLSTLVILLVSKTFNQVVSLAQNTAKARRSSHATTEKDYRPKSIVMTMALREWDIIRSASVFLSEILMVAFMPLVLIAIYAISGVLNSLSFMAQDFSGTVLFPVVVSGILILMDCFSQMSSTSISREGAMFAVSKTWPVPETEAVKGKLLAHMVILFIPHVAFTIICVVFFKFSFVHLIWMLPLGFFSILGTGALGLAIDYKRPNLAWKLPQQAIKQNMNALIGMGYSFAYLLVLAGVVVLGYGVLKFPLFITMVIACFASAILCYVSYKIACKAARRAFTQD